MYVSFVSSDQLGMDVQGMPASSAIWSCDLFHDALDFAAVDAESTGYGALTVSGLVPSTSRLIQRWRGGQCRWRMMAHQWLTLVGRPLRPFGTVTVLGPGQCHQKLDPPRSARAGYALTNAPTGPYRIPCARLAPIVAAMPAPRLHPARCQTRRFRRVASSMTIDAAKLR